MVADPPRGPDGDKEPPAKDPGLNALVKYIGLGMQLAVTVVLFTWLGGWLDEKYGWAPWGRSGLGMLGLALALYHFVRETTK